MTDNSNFTPDMSPELRAVWDSIKGAPVPAVPKANEVWGAIASAMRPAPDDRPCAEAGVSKPGSGMVRGRRLGKVGVFSGHSLRRWVGYGTVMVLVAAIWKGSDYLSGFSAGSKRIVYATQAGQRATVTLRDGSKVTLGPATTLSVLNTYSPNNSNAIVADVDGEALFNVTSSSQRPFSVTAHGVTTSVLGTEFVVRALDASLVRVAVRNGRVSVRPPALTDINAAIVNAGEAISVSSALLPKVVPIADIASEFAWADGELVLRNVPIGEAFVRLSKWYGIEFRVADPALLDAKVDATFPSVFSKADIDVLARVIGARATYAQGLITFYAD